MKNWLMNLWNAQENAERLEALEDLMVNNLDLLAEGDELLAENEKLLVEGAVLLEENQKLLEEALAAKAEALEKVAVLLALLKRANSREKQYQQEMR